MIKKTPGVKKAARSKSVPRSAPQRLWSWRGGIVTMMIVAAAAMVWFYRAPIQGYAGAGTAYTARVVCSCRFVGGRALGDCAKDKLAGMELISLKENIEEKSVTARFPLIVSETATYRKGYGCVLERWPD